MCIQNKLPIPAHMLGQQQPPQKPMTTETPSSGSGGGRLSDAAGGEASTGTYANFGGTSSRERYRAGVPRVASAFSRSEPVPGTNRHHFAWDEGKHKDEGLSDEASVYYHGTSAHDLPYIMAEASAPALGPEPITSQNITV